MRYYYGVKYISERQGATLVAIAALFLVIDIWGHITRAYVTMPNIDIATHILFGIWLALALIYRNNTIASLNVFLIVMLVGLGWEGLEFGYDHLFAAPHNISLAQHGIGDTVKDIVDNGAGALFLLFAFRKRVVEKSLAT